MKELYLIQTPYIFMGIQGDPTQTPFSILGVPFASTNSFRGGSRFAPLAVRIASQSLEAYSFRAGVDLESNPPYDEGDVAVTHGSAETTLRNLAAVTEELVKARRVPAVIGGDHTITYGVIEGLVRAGIKPCLLIFDAHLDFRHEYLGYKWSHACVTRRISELIGAQNILVVGVRAVSSRELRDAKSLELNYIPMITILRSTLRSVSSRISKSLERCPYIYVSVDMDALDPAYAPGVATPEPEEMTPTQLLNLLHASTDERVVGFDVVEVDPQTDNSHITSFLAARIMMEIMSYLIASRR
ncbi:MAG: agmatinase [Desulfurococcales archaeon]|nr:agmatinase [Desulfurococcales archaeon]